MSPTPVTFVSPTAPSTYSWEATDDEVAERYGVDRGSIVRFDLNTSPAPPELALRILAGGRFDTSLSEYPPSDYRRLVAAAATRYGVTPAELLVGAGADEILDLVAKAFLRPGDRAVVPVPTYAMYRVLTEQRGAEVVAVPRLGRAQGWALDLDAVRTAAADAAVVCCAARTNPPPSPSPMAPSSACSRASPRMPPATDVRRPSSSSTRRTPSSSGGRSSGSEPPIRTS